MGAHGGAGTTTIARLIGAADLGRAWPQAAEGHPPRVLVAARTNAAGLAAAEQMLARYQADGYPKGTYLAGFVLIADAPGRLPGLLSRRVARLAPATMVYRVPWVKTWRLYGTAVDQAMAVGLRLFAERAAMTATPSLPR